MPTLKPRVQVTLEPQTHDVIARLAKLQNRTRGSVIAELLDSVAPALIRTVALLEAAFEAPDQVKQGLRAVVEGVHDELVSVSGDSIKQLDMLMQRLDGDSEEGSTPVPVTRGSGTDSTPTPKPAKTRRKPSAKRGPAQ
jgi:hypothetical protein